MAYQFVTKCASCAQQFGVVWVMDSTRTGPESIARITCPLCRKSFHQHAGDLLPIGSQIQNLVVGRPVRSVEVDYDCPYCGKRGIVVSLLHTDLSWDELSKDHVQTAACHNGLCPHRGLSQKLKPSRVLLGVIEPSIDIGLFSLRLEANRRLPLRAPSSHPLRHAQQQLSVWLIHS